MKLSLKQFERISLLGILALAAVLRLGWPGLTEFKADEARLLTLALDLAEFKAMPWCGIGSSVGLPNSPISVYLTALPLLLPFLRNPIGAVLWVGALNVAAVGLCYLLTKRYWGTGPALVAALLFATAPWAVIYSRKIWAQNYLPLFTLGFIFAGLLALVEGRRRWLAVQLFLLAILIQIHPSTLAFVPLTIFLLVVFRRQVEGRWLGIGLGLAAVAFLPYVGCGLASASTGSGATVARLASQAPSVTLDSLAYAWLVSLGKDIHSLAGPEAFQAFLASIPNLNWLQWLEAALVALGVAQWIRLLRRTPNEPAARAGLVVIAWMVAPPLFFLWHTIPPFPHYFISMLPSPYLAAGVGAVALVNWSVRRARAGGWAYGLPVVIAAGQAFSILALLNFLANHNTPNGFGAPVGRQMQAVSEAQQRMGEAGAEEILFVSDGDGPASEEAPAVFSVLLRDLPHRLVNGQTAAVLPTHPSVVLLAPGESRARDFYFETVGASNSVQTIPLRPGEGEYSLFSLSSEANKAAPPHAAGPAQLANGVTVIGYGWQGEVAAGQEVEWQLWWRAAGSDFVGAPAYHFFNHLVDANDAQWSQQDGQSLSRKSWREGDLVVSFFELTVKDGAPAGPFWVRTGMYTFPELAPVTVLDEAGNPAGQDLKLGPLTK